MTSGRQRQVSGLIRLRAKYIQAHKLNCISTNKCSPNCIHTDVHAFMYSIMNLFSCTYIITYVCIYLDTYMYMYVHKMCVKCSRNAKNKILISMLGYTQRDLPKIHNTQAHALACTRTNTHTHIRISSCAALSACIRVVLLLKTLAAQLRSVTGCELLLLPFRHEHKRT